MTSSSHEPPPQQAAEGIPGLAVLGVLTAAIVISVASVFIAGWLLYAYRGQVDDAEKAPPVGIVGHIEQELFEHRARGQAKNEKARQDLERYGWVDRDAGIADVPIERTFDWMLKDYGGKPAPNAVCPARPAPTAAGAPGAISTGEAEGPAVPQPPRHPERLWGAP